MTDHSSRRDAAPTIVEFLNARLDEEVDAHQRVRQPYRLYVDDDGRVSEPKKIHDTWGEHKGKRDGDYVLWADGEDYMPNHIASWALIYDPARVLRRVEADRRLLEMHEPSDSGHCTTCLVGESDIYGQTFEKSPCWHLRLLALPYAGHEDYRKEWAVE